MLARGARSRGRPRCERDQALVATVRIGDAAICINRCRTWSGIDGYLPKSASGIAVTAQVMKWMQRWPFRSFAERKWFTTADAIDLPEYA